MAGVFWFYLYYNDFGYWRHSAYYITIILGPEELLRIDFTDDAV